MSKTPIVDECVRYTPGCVSEDVARRLESDRTELIDALRELLKWNVEALRELLEWNDENDWQSATKARALLARLEDK